MNLLMTTDAVGGVWTYSLELAAALEAHDVHTTLAVLGPPPSRAQRMQLEASGVADAVELGGCLEWMDDPWSSIDADGGRLVELADRCSADLVHLNGYSYASLPWNVLSVVVAHSDVRSWWQAVHGRQAPASWSTYHDRVAAGLADASAVVALTAAGRDDLCRQFGHCQAEVIANGRSAGWVRTMPKEHLILSAGRLWDEAKNVASLESIAALLEWPVYLAGETAPDASMALGEGNVYPLGPLPFDELAEWMARASIYVAPARYEPFGLGVLEAALSQCAVVLGDIASLREIWGDAAVYVDPEDPSALRAAIDQLCDDAPRRTDLARRAHARAQDYTAERMGRSYAALYASLIRAQAPR